MEENRVAALQFLTNRYLDNVWKHVGIHCCWMGFIFRSASAIPREIDFGEARININFRNLAMGSLDN